MPEIDDDLCRDADDENEPDVVFQELNVNGGEQRPDLHGADDDGKELGAVCARHAQDNETGNGNCPDKCFPIGRIVDDVGVDENDSGNQPHNGNGERTHGDFYVVSFLGGGFNIFNFVIFGNETIKRDTVKLAKLAEHAHSC